jgi:hypothetical protein
LPSDVILSSPSKERKEDNLSDTPSTPITKTTNGAVTTQSSIMSSSSSSSSLSVSTPSSTEHVTRKQIPSSLSSSLIQVLRRTSMSTPSAPITLILNKVKLFSFFFFYESFEFLGSKRFVWFNINTA